MSEKTEEATPKKKRQAREKGQVAKSAEATGVAVMLSAIAILVVTGLLIVERLATFTLQAIEVATRPELDSSAAGPFLFEAIMALGMMIGPLVAVTFVIAGFISYVQVGALFTIKPLIPDANKLNPVEGLKNIFKVSKLVDLAKNILKLTVMGAMGYVILLQITPPMALTPQASLLDATVALSTGALRLSLYLVGGLVAFGVFDFFWQRHQHNKNLRMAKHEVTQEHKESQGDPMLKGKREQFHREIMQGGGGINSVKQADAVVVNPTHIAVAIRYRSEEMRAPTIISCGKGVTAQKIKQMARRYDIPIVHNVELARALVEVGLEQEIPEEFFEPVAEILRFVYDLKRD